MRQDGTVLVLSLDTSESIGVALVRLTDDVVVLARHQVAEQRRHAELLAPLVAGALAEAGVDRREVDAVVVGTGPAPFTGLRAGLVTARAFGFALGVDVLGVPSLDALAAQAFADGLARGDDEVLVATDARRRELYLARYRAVLADGVEDVEAVAGPDVVRYADAPAWAEGAVVVGPGARLAEQLTAVAPGGPTAPDPVVLARLAVRRRERGLEQPTEPLYLRRPDVMPAAARKRATG